MPGVTDHKAVDRGEVRPKLGQPDGALKWAAVPRCIPLVDETVFADAASDFLA
jgi:hypothetical protein